MMIKKHQIFLSIFFVFIILCIIQRVAAVSEYVVQQPIIKEPILLPRDTITTQHTPEITLEPPAGNGVLFIPGIAGTGLYATLTNATLLECSPNPLNASRFRLWASVTQALPPEAHQRCWAEKLSLQWGPSQQCFSSVDDIYKNSNGNTLINKSKRIEFFSKKIINVNPPNSTFISTFCDNEYFSPKGVNVTVDSPGLTRGFDFLDYIGGVGVFGTKYFHDMLQIFKTSGYIEGDTLIGHPFDWRYPVWQLDFDGLKTTIENFVQRRPGKKLTLIAHSLGAVLVTNFLNLHVNSEWKDKHIEGFVSIAGAFGGSHKAIRSLITGYTEAVTVDFFGVVNISMISPVIARQAHRAFGSMYSMTPNLQLFNADTVIIDVVNNTCSYKPISSVSTWIMLIGHVMYKTFSLNYLLWKNTLLNTVFSHHRSTDRSQNRNLPGSHSSWPSLTQLLENMGAQSKTTQYSLKNWWELLPNEYQMLAQEAQEKMMTKSLVLLDDPGIPVYCFWSVFDVPTTEIGYTYNNLDLNIPPEIRFTYGDNTLVRESASHCKNWKSTVLSREFKNLVGWLT